MKKLLYISLLIIAFNTFCGFGFKPTEYTKKGCVISVIEPCQEYKNGLVTFIDIKGDMWSFDGSEDWLMGDLLLADMHDNRTSFTNKDDVILNVTYTGYIDKNYYTLNDIKAYLQ